MENRPKAIVVGKDQSLHLITELDFKSVPPTKGFIIRKSLCLGVWRIRYKNPITLKNNP
jgi:hypothetical protein